MCAARRTLELTDVAYSLLVDVRDHDCAPYMRVKATALLLVAAGKSPHWVAKHGLGKVYDPDSIYAWLDSYLGRRIQGVAGIAALRVQPGRGRTRCFSANGR